MHCEIIYHQILKASKQVTLNMNNKLLVIGLDGATWNLLKPLVEKGYLPTIKRLIEKGTHGSLISTIPPITGAAWTTLATGLNPGKTGILDFLNRKNSSYKLYVVNSHDFQGQTFWDKAAEQGYRIGIVNYPLLYPTYPINGFMISGVGSLEYLDITYPKSLRKTIDEIAQGYEVDFDIWAEKYNDIQLYVRDLTKLLEKRRRVICHLMQKKDWDVFIAVYSCTDWISHATWKHFDDKHPAHDPIEAKKVMKGMIGFWQKIDNALAQMMQLAGSNTTTILVSDHGFGSLWGCFNILAWLRKKGYLSLKKSIPTKKALRRIVRLFGRMILKTPLKNLIPRRLIDKESPILGVIGEWGKSVTERIDFQNSVAYTLENTIPFGGIWINLKGRDLKGIVNPGEEYDKIRNEIIEKLTKLPKEIGKDLKIDIFNPKELYTGDKMTYVPDILFQINDGQTVIVKTFDNKIYRDEAYLPRHTGAHRRAGIFLVHGPNIKQGIVIENPQIADIAPTILNLLNIPIPSEMDGKVLQDIFTRAPTVSKQEMERRKEQRRIRDTIQRLKTKGSI